MRFGHLSRRFFGSLRPGGPSPEDDAWARQRLLPGERELWELMSKQDRRHAIGVARRVERALGNEASRPVLAAALLHDVGKIDSRARHLRPGRRDDLRVDRRSADRSAVDGEPRVHSQGRALPASPRDRRRPSRARGQPRDDRDLDPRAPLARDLVEPPSPHRHRPQRGRRRLILVAVLRSASPAPARAPLDNPVRPRPAAHCAAMTPNSPAGRWPRGRGRRWRWRPRGLCSHPCAAPRSSRRDRRPATRSARGPGAAPRSSAAAVSFFSGPYWRVAVGERLDGLARARGQDRQQVRHAGLARDVEPAPRRRCR